MWSFFKTRFQAIKAAFAKRMVTKIIERELRLVHAQELSLVSANEWGPIRDRQAKEIAAVRDGNATVVDRRSWQWPYLPSSLSRIRQPIVKMTPYNIRRFMKSPVPRRCINLIKNSITSLDWDIVPVDGTFDNASDETKERCRSAKRCFEHPNLTEDYQTFMEIGIDDMMTFGAFVSEPQITPDPKRPMKMWVVDSSTIRIYPTWRESDPDEPHYAQMTGLRGERGIIVFYDDELMYLRDNPSIETPFGLGRGEVAFQSVNALIGVQEMSGRAGADQTHRTWLWWEGAQYGKDIEVIRRHLTNDIEGQAKINIQTGMKPPQVIEVTPTQESDLLLNWQELLMRMISNAFDLSPLSVGIERDVNRSTGEVLDDRDFRSAVVPVATKLATGFTRFFLHRKLGWTDVKFQYLNLDDPDTMTKMTIQSQMYQSNATTPNLICKSLGYPELATPWANLTMMEAIVANAEVMANIQDQNAEKANTRMQQNQDRQMQQYQQMNPGQGSEGEQQEGEPDPYGGGDEQQGAGMPGIKKPSLPGIKSPKGPSTPGIKPPKLPKLGGFTGSQLAAMTPKQFQAAVASGLAPSNATQAKQKIGQSVLFTMNKELQQYLDVLEKSQAEDQESEEFEPTAEDYKKQMDRYNKSQHKQTLIEKTVYNVTPEGIPRTRANQGLTTLGLGKETPNFVSDPRVARSSSRKPRRSGLHDVRARRSRPQ